MEHVTRFHHTRTGRAGRRKGRPDPPGRSGGRRERRDRGHRVPVPKRKEITSFDAGEPFLLRGGHLPGTLLQHRPKVGKLDEQPGQFLHGDLFTGERTLPQRQAAVADPLVAVERRIPGVAVRHGRGAEGDRPVQKQSTKKQEDME